MGDAIRIPIDRAHYERSSAVALLIIFGGMVLACLVVNDLPAFERLFLFGTCAVLLAVLLIIRARLLNFSQFAELVIDQTGVHEGTASYLWADIADVFLSDVDGNPVVAFRFKNRHFDRIWSCGRFDACLVYNYVEPVDTILAQIVDALDANTVHPLDSLDS